MGKLLCVSNLQFRNSTAFKLRGFMDIGTVYFEAQRSVSCLVDFLMTQCKKGNKIL